MVSDISRQLGHMAMQLPGLSSHVSEVECHPPQPSRYVPEFPYGIAVSYGYGLARVTTTSSSAHHQPAAPH